MVGNIVMEHLAKLDEVAYIRFASVYHEFDDAQDFVQAISAIVEPRKAPIGPANENHSPKLSPLQTDRQRCCPDLAKLRPAGPKATLAVQRPHKPTRVSGRLPA